MLNRLKLALRISTTAYDADLLQLIDAGFAELEMLGIPARDLAEDPLIVRAVITYCKIHFGQPDDYDRFVASYNTQIARLLIAHGYGAHRQGGTMQC